MRPTWDEYFILQALLVSSRATCNRLKVGAIITRNNHVIATGYNGSLQGDKHCVDDGCLVEDGHCIRTIHAETNAILQCAKSGAKTTGATIYVTHFPCQNCVKKIIQADISVIKYYHDYGKSSNYTKEMLKAHDIQCISLNTPKTTERINKLLLETITELQDIE